MLKNSLRRLTPAPAWRAASRVKGALLDLRDSVFGRDGAIRPPRTASFVGSGDFEQVGAEFRRLFIDIGGLKPSDDVLDVGSGIGRMAVPLTDYLDPGARFEGFDIVQSGVDWCTDNITARFPNFRFTHADIYNKEYNPRGAIEGKDFVFPYADASFDFVFLTSVFTHMLPADVEHYLAEIARVTKPGGRSFITWLVLDDAAVRNVAAGKAAFDVSHPLDGCYVMNREVPEDATAYPVAAVEQAYAKAGLRLVEPIRWGAWSGRASHLSFQDICLAEKPAA